MTSDFPVGIPPWTFGDRIAARVGMWALQRLYGANCKTDVRDDFPDDPDIECLDCYATKLVADMKEILEQI